MRCPLLEHSGKSLLTLLECETSPILLTECVELHLSLCSLQVLWVLQKPNGADAWALWKLPSLWLSVWTNRISHGLQPFLWEILRLGWLFWSSDRSEFPGRKNLVDRKKDIYPETFFHCLLCQLKHKGNDYSTCLDCLLSSEMFIFCYLLWYFQCH